jgi:hypothetical protein
MPDLISKITKSKQGVAQVIDFLPSKLEALSSNPRTDKEKKRHS